MFAKRFFTQENTFLAGLGLFCIAYVAQSGGLGQLSARVPRAVALLALGLIIYMLAARAIESARAEGNTEAPPAQAEIEAEPAQAAKPPKTIPWTLMCLISLIYPGLIMIIGFSIATAVYLFGVGRLLAYPWVKGLVFAVIYTAATVFLFQYILNVPLPVGMLWEYLLGL